MKILSLRSSRLLERIYQKRKHSQAEESSVNDLDGYYTFIVTGLRKTSLSFFLMR